jgi:hypothetical protein
VIFLIDYDRRKGKLRDFRRFQDFQMPEARSERLRIELSDKAAVMSGDREVVLLEADDEKTLHRTHQRYFKSARDIVKSIMDSEPAQP